MALPRRLGFESCLELQEAAAWHDWTTTEGCEVAMVGGNDWTQALVVKGPVASDCCVEEGWETGLSQQLAQAVCACAGTRAWTQNYKNIAAEGHETDDARVATEKISGRHFQRHLTELHVCITW